MNLRHDNIKIKPVSFQVPRQERETVKFEHDKVKFFYDSLHLHKDFQLTFIKKSFGTLYVGDQVLPFREGELFLFGSNLPHVLKNDEVYYTDSTAEAESFSLYFQLDFARIDFGAWSDYALINELLVSAQKGFKIEGSVKDEIINQLPGFDNKDSFARILCLLTILQDIARKGELIPLAKTALYSGKRTDDHRIRKVVDYIINHYHESIPLSFIASLVSMTETSFCRYFKQHTRKTFSKYLSEIRVEAGCKQLLAGNSAVSQVCFEVGFNNLSNFNRQFKSITGYSPKEYVKHHQVF